MSECPTTHFEEQNSYRLIPSKYPPIHLYEDVATPDLLDAIFEIEALTNPRLLEETGDFSRIPVDERLVGMPHCSYVMAAFTHYAPEGGRFNTPDFGAYYCAPSVDTAIKETVYHMERIMGFTNEPAQEVQMRAIAATFSAELSDLSKAQFASTELYHPTNYSHAQATASELKSHNSDGVYYLSVRHSGHTCFALYKPSLVSSVCQAKHYSYVWNGSAINNVLELSLV
jgi:RES domain-containing protein